MTEPTAKPEILVIEDDDQTANWMRFMLEKDGWSVRHAASGKAANEIVDGGGALPWLVTLDLGLPDTSGVDLMVHLKGSAGWNRVPIVVVTATPKDENVNWAIKKGARAYLVKPFNPEELQATVKRLARKPD